MRSFITNGNAVSAYTASPSLAFLVEMACFSSNGILLPAGITAEFGSGASAGVTSAGEVVSSFAGAGLSDDVAPPALAAESTGFVVSGACPQAIPETSSTVKIARIQHLPGIRSRPRPSQLTTPWALGCGLHS